LKITERRSFCDATVAVVSLKLPITDGDAANSLSRNRAPHPCNLNRAGSAKIAAAAADATPTLASRVPCRISRDGGGCFLWATGIFPNIH
jgi:hypothetical protein